MAFIGVQDVSFTYPGSLAPVFEGVTLQLDTSWRLGLVGRNGRGKTTFLNLLRGCLHGTGQISSDIAFEYFPPQVPAGEETALEVARGVIAPFTRWEAEMARLAAEGTEESIAAYGDIEQAYAAADGYDIDERITAECGRLDLQLSILQRPFSTLSGGERVKLLLAAQFLKKHRFLLVDEPTDHLDLAGRQTVARWLAGKSGFILVSHDRAFLDEAVDHILAINRSSIELQQGNYSSWRQNRDRQDAFELAENQKLQTDIRRLQVAVRQTKVWSDQVEKSKKSNGNATYQRGAASVDRGYIGHQAAKMMKRSKSIERRREQAVEDKKSLLKDLEESEPLRFQVLPCDKRELVTVDRISLAFGDRMLFRDISFRLTEGARIAVTGDNGSGKSSLLRLVTGELEPGGGTIKRAGGLVVSSVVQETAVLSGTLRGYAADRDLDLSLFLAILRKLDFERSAFDRPIETYSAGQKKKVALAASLAKPAHLFVWDEPLNYIDVLSREQIEQAVLAYCPALLFVEHDRRFCERVAQETIRL